MHGNPESSKTHWRRLLGVERSGGPEAAAGLESAGRPAPASQRDAESSPADRIRSARERMRSIVVDALGGDRALLDAIDCIALSGGEAVAILQQDDSRPLQSRHTGALEVVVAFDGTRPSFLLLEDYIDFESSWSTSAWKTTLAPRMEELARFASCVGRVETADEHIGTAFLVAPTLALTNRHVAQTIAELDGVHHRFYTQTFLDFGREHRGRRSHDRREILRILLTGTEHIGDTIDHGKLDLALLELSPSTLKGAVAERHLHLRSESSPIAPTWVVAAVGYPADWRTAAPPRIASEFETVLTRLLAGDGGSKRFAPGTPTGMLFGNPSWTLMHDATTIKGNSGSALVIVRGSGELEAAGLHYGGSWSGQRTNWAHVLGRCGDALVLPGRIPLRSALADAGIAF